MQLQVIQQKIFEIRDQKVMLDFDLAELYEVETKAFNQAVKRNLDRFPEEFMFKLTKSEWEVNWSQFVTSSQKNRRKDALPYAFTEHGITMVASILRSEKAINMNIAIVRAFIAMRKIALQYTGILGQIDELNARVSNHDDQLNQIYEAIENLLGKKEADEKWQQRNRIGFKQN